MAQNGPENRFYAETIGAVATLHRDYLAKTQTRHMDSEKRRVYRVAPDEVNALDVTVKTEDGEVFPGKVLDITIDGVGISFEKEGGPELGLSKKVTLIFSGAALGDPVEVFGEVRSRVEAGEFRHYRYGVAFDQSAELEKRLPAGIFRLFNRRGAFRSSPDPTKPVEVSVTVPGVKGTKITTLLKDISISGLAFLLEPEAESILGAIEVIEMSFRLPTSDEDFELLGRIRRRELIEKDILYGVEFDDQTEDFGRRREEISAYVMHRQREELKNRNHRR